MTEDDVSARRLALQRRAQAVVARRKAQQQAHASVEQTSPADDDASDAGPGTPPTPRASGVSIEPWPVFDTVDAASSLLSWNDRGRSARALLVLAYTPWAARAGVVALAKHAHAAGQLALALVLALHVRALLAGSAPPPCARTREQAASAWLQRASCALASCTPPLAGLWAAASCALDVRTARGARAAVVAVLALSNAVQPVLARPLGSYYFLLACAFSLPPLLAATADARAAVGWTLSRRAAHALGRTPTFVKRPLCAVAAAAFWRLLPTSRLSLAVWLAVGAAERRQFAAA